MCSSVSAVPWKQFCYRLQLQGLCFYTCLSVILFTGGGEYLGRYPRKQAHPPWQVHTPRAGTHTLGRYPPPPTAGIPQAATPPDRYTPWPGTLPWPKCMLGYSQQAGGMHSTGMHSCFLYFQSNWCVIWNCKSTALSVMPRRPSKGDFATL